MSKSPSLRRIQADIRELTLSPSDQYYAHPIEDNMFEWHFTIRGASKTDFEGGVYHGRILLPPEYPFKPPNIIFLTPSGRFETNTKVCLSFSSFHPELWQPAWGIRLILEALISFLPTPADGAIGALDWTKEERIKLARESVKFTCPVCCEVGQTCVDLLPELKSDKVEEGKKTRFHEEIEKLKMLQFQNHAVEEEEGKDEEDSKAKATQKSEADETEDKSKSLVTDNKSQELTQKSESVVKAETPLQKANTNATATQPPQTTNTPIPALANQTNESTTTTTSEATPTAETTIPHPGSIEQAPLVSDHCLNGMIAVLAFIVIALVRQAQTLIDEMRSLEDS